METEDAGSRRSSLSLGLSHLAVGMGLPSAVFPSGSDELAAVSCGKSATNGAPSTGFHLPFLVNGSPPVPRGDSSLREPPPKRPRNEGADSLARPLPVTDQESSDLLETR